MSASTPLLRVPLRLVLCLLCAGTAMAQDVKPASDVAAAVPATTPPAAVAPAAPMPSSPQIKVLPPLAPAAPGTAPVAGLRAVDANGMPIAPDAASMVTTPARDISQLAWMHGCWSGTVNKRSFTEQWTAPAAGMMLGLGHTTLGDKTESFEFMRVETLPDGRIAYILRPQAKEEEPFVFQGVKTDKEVEFFIFTNPRIAFPARIIYSHASQGRMFVHVQGKVNGADREVVYPFVPVSCATGKPV